MTTGFSIAVSYNSRRSTNLVRVTVVDEGLELLLDGGRCQALVHGGDKYCVADLALDVYNAFNTREHLRGPHPWLLKPDWPLQTLCRFAYLASITLFVGYR